MTQLAEGMDKKSFLMLIACVAESADNDTIVKFHEDVINRYKKAKENNESKEKLNIIFNELMILSYINVARLIGKNAFEIINEIETIDRVLNIINPIPN